MKRIFFILAVIIVIIFTIIGCTNPASSFENAVSNGNYEEAIEIYQDKLAGNSTSENEAIAYLESYLDYGWSNYVTGNLTEQGFFNRYTTLKNINDALHVMDDLDSLYQTYLAVKASKEAFTNAISYSRDGDYRSAIEALSYVVPEDTEHYEAAQSKLANAISDYQESVIDSTVQLADAGRFDEAIGCVEEAITVIGNTEALDNSLRELHTERYSNEMDTAYTAGDYASVIETYASAKSNPYVILSSTMTSMYSSCVTNFLDSIRANAEEAFGADKNYGAAIQIIQAASITVLDDAEVTAALDEMIAEYQEYIPVALAALEYTQKGYYLEVGNAYTSSAKDVNSTVYDASTVICPWAGHLKGDVASDENDGYVLYNLNMEYSTMSGVIYRPYSSLSCETEWVNPTTVKIYGDDVLLYEAPNFTLDTYDPVEFQISVAGVRNLKIVMLGVWGESNGWVGMYSRYPKVCMAETMLQK